MKQAAPSPADEKLRERVHFIHRSVGTDAIVDVCIMNGDTAQIAIEADLFQTVDAGRAAGLGGKADDPFSGEVKIASAQKYGERCVAELAG